MESILMRNWNVSCTEPRTVWTASVLSISGPDQQTGSSESRLDYWFLASVARGVVIVIAAAFGLALNSFIVFAVLANRKLRGKVVNVLHCHLAAVDIVWCVVLLPFPALSGLYGWWDELCEAYAVGRTLMTHATVWTIASLGWDKYRTIASPMRHSPAAELLPVSACLGAIWMAGLLVGTLPFLLCFANSSSSSSSSLSPGATDDSEPPAGNHTLGAVPGTCSGYFYDSTTGLCSASLDRSEVSWYSLFLSVETFCLPLVFLAYSYCHIFRIARWQKKRIAVMAAMVRVITLSVGVPITHENARRTSNQVSTRSRKALRTVCVFLGAFLVCYGPYGVTSLAGSLYGVPLHPLPVALADLLLMTSPTVNAVVYGVRNRMLQQSFRNCVRRKCAQYALKFPGLQDTLLRRFGSPEPTTDQQVRFAPEQKAFRLNYEEGQCSAKWVEVIGAYRQTAAHTSDTLSTRTEKRDSVENLKRDKVFIEVASSVSELRHPSEIVRSEGLGLESAGEKIDSQKAQPTDQIGDETGFNIHTGPVSRRIISYDDFKVKGGGGGVGVTWKFVEGRGSVIEGKGRLVVGADVHSTRKTSELTAAV